VNLGSQDDGTTPLLIVSHQGFVEVVELLLDFRWRGLAWFGLVCSFARLLVQAARQVSLGVVSFDRWLFWAFF
jgi:hypothetical protein